eukprot:Lithocolla_globosa_v1_NODE_50_length_7733_cov_357.538291.p4 type:complete len:185 gc:universal NODE_50_length_7733_cov_357.538291:6549-5995(-)
MNFSRSQVFRPGILLNLTSKRTLCLRSRRVCQKTNKKKKSSKTQKVTWSGPSSCSSKMLQGKIMFSLKNYKENITVGEIKNKNLLPKLLSFNEAFASFRNIRTTRFLKVLIPCERAKMEDNKSELPQTKMGISLKRLVDAIWDGKEIPDTFSIAAIFSLMKKGDPVLRDNYRGISLISVVIKAN